MALAKHHNNFATLRRAWEGNNVALMECRRRSDGADVALICAVGREGDDYVFTPLAEMVNGNPYDMYDPPTPDGGFVGPEEG